MSGIKKGTARKAPTKPTPSSGAAGGAAKKQQAPKKAAGAAAGGSSSSSSGGAGGKGVQACFAGCGVSGKHDVLVEHYEKVLSSNESKHIAALSEQLDPHFSDPTHCQICGSEALHSGLLLKHIFNVATKKATGAQAAHNAEMHATLFSSFVQELLTMPQVGKADAVEYMLSLLVPDYDPDDDSEDDEDDEENDLYEDDDDDDDGLGDEVDSEELEAFEAFLESQGLDLAAMGMDEDGPAKMKFMQKMMQQMAGGHGMEDDDEEDDEDEEEEEEERPRGKKAAAAKGGKASAAAASPNVPAGTNKPGDLKCGSCDQMRHKDLYSSAQQKKKGKRRCKYCVDAETGTNTAAAASSAAAGSSNAASAAPAAAAAAASSSAAGSRPSHAHTLHQHHALRHTLANGEEIHPEPEEFDGDGEPRGDDTEDDDEEEDSDDDDDDEEEDEMDPLSALFGRPSRRGRRNRGKAAKKAKRQSMGMQLVKERPGQLLTRDRRLRLKPSESAPIRCWLPRDGEVACFECEWRVPSRLVQGWRVACMNCALENDWMEDDEAFASDEEEDEERDPRLAVQERLEGHKARAYQASTFPAYRAGIARCARPSCNSHKLLLVYDEKGDEYVICVECMQTKQKLRYFDSLEHRLIDSLQEPDTHD